MDKKDVEERIQKENYVVRFKTPSETNVVFNDIIRGEILVGTRDIDDKILFKIGQDAPYHLANVVDDHLMKSHMLYGVGVASIACLACAAVQGVWLARAKICTLAFNIKTYGKRQAF